MSAKPKPKVRRLSGAGRAAVPPVQLAPARKVRAQAPRTAPPVAGEGTPPVASVRGKRPAREAWSKIAEPLRERKGIRVLFYGITGKGKTHGIADFLDFVVAGQLVDLVLVHDVKLPEKQYAGDVIHEAAAVNTIEGAPENFPAVRVLRKRDIDHVPSVEGAARVTLESGYADVSSVLVIDEFQRALTDGGRFDSPSVRRLFCEGLGMHASIIAAKQLPQHTPTEATGQSTVIYFGTNGEGANFLLDEKKVPRELYDVIRGLAVREFVYIPQEGDWDGFVYEVPFRT